MKIESNVIFFPCRDIKETKEYYTEVVGLKVYKDLGNLVWFDSGYGYLAFVQYAPDRPMATGECISFNLSSIEAVDGMYEALLNKPVIGLKGAPKQHPVFPVYSFFFSDPNGYTLEFQKPTDGDER
ncbi:MAG: VOC family protein [Clostridia bacterium]|nr:VOC family protein [Clostridia bacterium]